MEEYASRFLPTLCHVPKGAVQKTIELPKPETKHCICCLSKDDYFISLIGCRHAEYLDLFPIPSIQPPVERIVCNECHNMLKKIKQFKRRVQESFNSLLRSTIPEILPKKALTISKALELELTPTQEDSNMPKNKNLKTQKNKNIETALEIINGNVASLQYFNSDNLKNITEAVLHMTSSNFAVFTNKPKSSETTNGEFNTLATIKNKGDSSQTDKCQSDSTEIVLPVEEATGDMIVLPVENKEENGCDIIFEVLEGDIKLEIEFDNSENSVFNLQESYENMSDDTTDGVDTIDTAEMPPFIPRILSEKEVHRERMIKMYSINFRKSPYKCEYCVVGFKYKENLEDHNNRKHTVRPHTHPCSICQQVVPIPEKNDHKFRHYNRLECMNCKQHFVLFDEAYQHYKKAHGGKIKKKRFLRPDLKNYWSNKNNRKKWMMNETKADELSLSEAIPDINPGPSNVMDADIIST